MYNVQFPDTNISHAYFAKFEKDMLLVKKVFLTVQGEGPFAGVPAVFVRLAGCNRGAKVGMNCEFCDTDFRIEGVRPISVAKLAQQVRDIRGGATLVVITGGEPMLQPALIPFIEALFPGTTMEVQIESNGDRLLPYWSEVRDTVHLVVSPKLSGREQARYLPPREDVLAAADSLKFLIDHRPESFYHQVPDYADKWQREGTGHVFVSPIAVYKRPVAEGEIASAWDSGLIDSGLTRKNYAYAAKLAIERDFVVSIQQHLFLSAE